MEGRGGGEAQGVADPPQKKKKKSGCLISLCNLKPIYTTVANYFDNRQSQLHTLTMHIKLQMTTF
jgi:hypothetical protein